MKRVSQQFGIAGSQGSFDFIDVDVEGDTPLFIDPVAIAQIDSDWAASCTAGIQSFFQRVLDYVVAGDRSAAEALMSYLGEDNSTHLGYSANSEGSGVGPGLARRFYDELSGSVAVQSGLISDLEDTALMIEGVREDRISDVVTNIIRGRLAEFTVDAATFYDIPLTPGISLGYEWNHQRSSWEQGEYELPVTPKGPLLLVPKSIVRRSLFFNPSEYYRHYVLEYFKARELQTAHSPLVQVLKSGEKRIKKGDVEHKYREKHYDPNKPGVEKRVNVDATQQEPALLDQYKKDKLLKNPPTSQPHAVIAEASETEVPDFQALLAAVQTLTTGLPDATHYEKAVEALLSALFYPDLINPRRQHNIHEGRKRIDLSFTNSGRLGSFFYWLAMHHPAANVVVECKNYSRPLANPEYDQIAGRFSPSRGTFGLLVYRQYEDKDAILASCRDTASDHRGFIIPLDDQDLAALVVEVQTSGSCTEIDGLLRKRFNGLVE